MKIYLIGLIYLILNLYQQAYGKESIYQHEASDLELANIIKKNELVSLKSSEKITWQPATDTENFKYILMSSETGFGEVTVLRDTIAKNLPENVYLVLLTTKKDSSSVFEHYSKIISKERLILVEANETYGGFWARDAFPYPIIHNQGAVSLVVAKYYRDFTAANEIAQKLNIFSEKYNHTFVGGNLMADSDANCFTVNSPRKFTTTESILKQYYGCKNVIYLPYLAGIGDVDEVIKILPNKKVLTNQLAYLDLFKQLGYQVILLPEIKKSYRTYANSLIVGQNVFMPSYQIKEDNIAKKVYEDLGYTVIPIISKTLSDDMHGSIHCQTMAYPDMPIKELLQQLELVEIK